MAASVLISLIIITLYYWRDENRVYTCGIVTLVTALSYFTHFNPVYFELVEVLGFYGYMCLTPLIAIALLYQEPNKLSTCLMALFTGWVGINTAFFWLEGIGAGSETGYQAAQLIVFIAEVVLMISKRATDGTYRALQQFGLAGSSPAHDGHHNHSNHIHKHHLGSN